MYPEILDIAKLLKEKDIDFDLLEWQDGYMIAINNDIGELAEIYQHEGSYLSELGLLEIIIYNREYEYVSPGSKEYVLDIINGFLNKEKV